MYTPPDAYANKQRMSAILRVVLAAIYLLLIGAGIWLCRDYHLEYILDRIIPYGLPPLFTLLSASFLSIFVLTLEQPRTETLLFSVICLAFAGLNTDIFLLGIITDPETALLISRIDHFMLVLVPLGANLHLMYLVCEKKNHWWVVYSAYGVGAVMAMFTPTALYFQGVYTYFWGFFAKKAVLYDVMSLFWMAGTLYGIGTLFYTYRSVSDPHKKNTIIFILLGFVCAAVLSLGNTPAIYGYEVYPLGTFSFIALLLLAYGLFKSNLRIALQRLRRVIFTVGHLSLITAAALAPSVLLPESAHQVKLVMGIILVVVLYRPVYLVWDAFLSLFVKRSADLLQKELYALTFRLSEARHVKLIYKEVCGWFFRLFMNSRFAMAFAGSDPSRFKGWSTVNPEPFSGFFHRLPDASLKDVSISIPAEHPILKKIAATRNRLISHALITRWMDELRITRDSKDALQEARLILAVFSEARLLCLLLIGDKRNNRSYTGTEKEVLENLSAVLAPVIENANLLEGLRKEINARTWDLYQVMKKLEQKNRKILENTDIIKKQNHIFLSLFETATRIHGIEDLHELFADTLNHLRALFPNLGFGIIHEGDRPEVIESGAFIGISEREQNLILENRHRLTDRNISQLMNENLPAFDPRSKRQAPHWTLQAMQIQENRVIGKIIIKGPQPDQITSRIISIFLAQVSAAAHNKILMRKLETTANTDGLTGVANRSFFDRELARVIKNSKLFSNFYFSIIVIDINGLKRVNDNYGHEKGDEMIKRVAAMLQSICRETDTLARIGGDEFVILLPAINSKQAQAAVERIRKKEKELFLICQQAGGGKVTLPIRFSIGYAGSDESAREEVLKLADQRMYVDKDNFYWNTIEDLYPAHR